MWCSFPNRISPLFPLKPTASIPVRQSSHPALTLSCNFLPHLCLHCSVCLCCLFLTMFIVLARACLLTQIKLFKLCFHTVGGANNDSLPCTYCQLLLYFFFLPPLLWHGCHISNQISYHKTEGTKDTVYYRLNHKVSFIRCSLPYLLHCKLASCVTSTMWASWEDKSLKFEDWLL